MLLDQIAIEKEAIPEWVSNENISYKFWTTVLMIKKEKESFISTYSERGSKLPPKFNYSISKKEVSKKINCAPASFHNRIFSPGLDKFFKKTNSELENSMRVRMEKLKKVGMKDRRKLEIIKRNQELKVQLDTIERKQVENQVDEIFKRVEPKVREILMLI